MSAACKWCGGRAHTKPMWHRSCDACLEPFTQPRKGVPRKTCGKPLCAAIHRYRWLHGRWPPRLWFTRYAAKAGLVKLPRKIEKLAARAA